MAEYPINTYDMVSHEGLHWSNELESNGILYYLATIPSLPDSHERTIYCRRLSELAALLSVVCLFLLASDMYGSKTGICAIFVLCINSIFIGSASSARFYAFNLAAVSLSLLSLWYAYKQNSTIWMITHGIAMLLSVSTTLLSISMLLPYYIFVWNNRHNKNLHRLWIQMALLAIILFILLVYRDIG